MLWLGDESDQVYFEAASLQWPHESATSHHTVPLSPTTTARRDEFDRC